jgi:hypothetical protein
MMASAMALAVLTCMRPHVTALAHAVSARLAGTIAPAENVTWELGNPADPVEELTPFIAFVLAVALAALGVAVAVGVQRLARRQPRIAWIAAAAATALSLFVGFHGSRDMGISIVLVGSIAAVFFVPYVGGGNLRASPTSPSRLTMSVLVGEAIALTWGAWLIAAPRGVGPLVVILVVLAVGIAALRVGQSLAVGDDGRRAMLDALTGAPLLALPWLGLLRAPSPVWVALAALAGGVVRVGMTLGKTPGRPALEAVLARVAFVLVPLSLGSILVIPLGFRALPDENYLRHEGFHAGYVSSIYHGKLMMADASFIYGPVREYILAALLALSRPTLEHLRMAHLFLNLTGLALLLATGWRLVRGRWWIQLWLMYIALTATPLHTFVQSEYYICFGWADVLRSALPMFALVGTLGAVASLPSTGAATRKDLRTVLAWSALIGFSFLYSQEYGLVATLCALVAGGLHRAVHARGTVRERAGAVACALAVVVAGCGAPFALMAGVYAFFGKAGLLVRTTFHIGALVAGGKFNGFPIPITTDDFLQPWELIRLYIEGQQHDARYHDANVEFLVVPAVVTVATIALVLQVGWRRWTSRTTLMLAMVMFSAASYRMTIARADIYHVLGATTGPCLLAAMMVADASTLRLYLGRSRSTGVPLGALAAAGVVAFSILAGETTGAVRAHAMSIASGELAPPTATPYDHADLPRAGDIYVRPGTVAVIKYIRAHSQSRDPIFCRIDMLRCGEIYFLADRRNATGFDTIHEIATPSMQADANRALRRELPELVIGTDEKYIGPEASAFLREAYDPPEDIGGFPVARRHRPR